MSCLLYMLASCIGVCRRESLCCCTPGMIASRAVTCCSPCTHAAPQSCAHPDGRSHRICRLLLLRSQSDRLLVRDLTTEAISGCKPWVQCSADEAVQRLRRTTAAQRGVRAVMRHLVHSMMYGKAMSLLVADICTLFVIVDHLDGLCFLLHVNCLKHLLRSCPARHDIAKGVPCQLIAMTCNKAHTQSA